jgi:hypothetical protein
VGSVRSSPLGVFHEGLIVILLVPLIVFVIAYAVEAMITRQAWLDP